MGKKFKLFVFCLIISFCCYGLFLNAHYSGDSYSAFYESNRGDAMIQLINARYVNYFIWKVLSILGINPVVHQGFFSLFLIVIIAISSYKLSDYTFTLIDEKNHNMYVVVIMFAIAFCNPYVLQWFLCPEMTLFYGISLISVVGATLIWNDEDANNIFRITATFVLFCISLCSYQASMPFFVIFSILFFIIKNEFKVCNKLLRKISSTIILAFLGCVMLMVSQKIIDLGGRQASMDIQTMLANFKILFQKQPDYFWNGDGYYLVGLLIVSMAVLVAIFLFLLIKKGIKTGIILFIPLLMGYALIFAPHLLSESMWLAPRTLAAFFSIFSVLLLLSYSLSNGYEEKLCRYLLQLTAVVLIVSNIFMVNSIGVYSFASNILDFEHVVEIQRYIEKYERETGKIVTKIAACYDKNPTYAYKGIKYAYYDTNTSGLVADWSDVNAINFYNGKNYERVNVQTLGLPQEMFEKDWDYFDAEEQLKFIEDTLVWIKY